MSVPTATLLSQIENAISNLLLAIDDDAVQEYTVRGRTYKRADFGKTLDTLLNARDRLKAQVTSESRSPVRVARLGRARPSR